MSLELSGTTPAIKGVAGSVSAPAITGDDADTGISFPAADTIKFSTGGVERMSITNSGVTGTGIGAGKILQVVQKKLAASYETTSTSYVEVTGLLQALTLSNASNKVLMKVKLHTVVFGASNMRSRSQLRFGDFASADGLSTHLCGVYNVTGASGTEYAYVPHTHQVLHTPGTATPTYRLGVRCLESGQTVRLYQENNVDGVESSIVFMEIAA